MDNIHPSTLATVSPSYHCALVYVPSDGSESVSCTEGDPGGFDASRLPQRALARLQLLASRTNEQKQILLIRLRDLSPVNFQEDFQPTCESMDKIKNWVFYFVVNASEHHSAVLYRCKRPSTWADFQHAVFNAYETYRQIMNDTKKDFPAILCSKPLGHDDHSVDDEDDDDAPLRPVRKSAQRRYVKHSLAH